MPELDVSLFGGGESFDAATRAFADALRECAAPARIAPPASPRQADPDRWETSLESAAVAIQTGRIDALGLAERALERAGAWQPHINCFIEIERDAARQAAARGAPGALAGIPVAHKDMFLRSGHVVSCGSDLWRDWQAGRDATLVARLRAAGVTEIGRLNMAEFAMGPTGHNAHYGATRNPWNRDYITGGSSSGSAGAVGAGIVYAALGSDTGGSIRVPAACCGITGLKPTYARLSRNGAMHLSSSLDVIGPLARSAADIAMVMDQLDGPDPADPTCWAPPARFADKLGGDVRGIRLGVPEAYFWEGLDPGVEECLRTALRVFEQLGCGLKPVAVPSMDHPNAACLSVAGYESTARHRAGLDAYPDAYGPQTRTRLLRGLSVSEDEYASVRAVRPGTLADFVRQAFAQADILVTPILRRPVLSLAESDVGGGPRIADLLADLSYETRGFSYLGLPNLVFPVGRVQGLPMGMMLVGRPYAEADLLAVADAYQQVTAWHRTAPRLPD